MFSFWWIIFWTVASVVIMLVLGWNRRFLTRKIRTGKYIIKTRIPVKMVKFFVNASTIGFGILLVTESLLAIARTIVKPLTRGALNGWAVVLLPVVAIAMIYCYHCMIVLAFNESSRFNEKRLKDSLIQHMVD